MEEKYLPIGTVVLLKDAKKKLMITGFLSVPNNDPGKVFDYTGCIYPEGYLSSNQVCLFNHDQIKEIFYLGFKNEEEEKFKENLKAIVDKKNAEKTADTEK